ncbi:MAG: hypothetical protein P8J68_10690 [Arenicellaceae bacterium]|nr:hypothetical protein [Arenicellaceae bacterium]
MSLNPMVWEYRPTDSGSISLPARGHSEQRVTMREDSLSSMPVHLN